MMIFNLNILLLVLCGSLISTEPIVDKPQAEISNGIIKAHLYLPNAENGYYMATRFDWSGIISSLEYNGHNYFGQWFEKYSPTIHDAIMGPVESFDPVNYENTKVGSTFVKIGVGLLTRTSNEDFNSFTTYPIVDPGTWKIQKKSDQIQFTQELVDEHYSYEYTKTVQLVKGKPEMVISHVLKNKGDRTIKTSVFNHNFFVIDNQPVGTAFELTFAKDVACTGRSINDFPLIQGNKVTLKKDLLKGENIYCSNMEGINNNVEYYDIKIENHTTGAGARITGDQAISRLVLWASSTTLCPEPYIDIKVESGQEFEWTYTYEFFTFDALE